MQRKDTFLYQFSKSFDLALIALQSIDIYSYINFLQQLDKTKNGKNLLILMFKIRFNYRLKSNRYFNSKLKSNLFIDNLNEQEIKEVLFVLSNILKNKFCSQKINYLFFYFISEKTIFKTTIKLNSLKNFVLFDFWISEYQKRFNLIFLKINPQNWNKKLYQTILNNYLRKSLFYLILYKNI